MKSKIALQKSEEAGPPGLRRVAASRLREAHNNRAQKSARAEDVFGLDREGSS